MGLMHITGHRDGPPAKVGVAVTDLTTGLYTSNSIMAALLTRARTGKGQRIDVALADCQVATLANLASSVLISGKPDTGRWGTAHPSIVPYKGFNTKDGNVMLGGGNDRLFGILCDKLGKPEWKSDAKFVTNADRVKHRDELETLIEEITTTKTTDEWLEVLEGCGMPYAKINDVKQTLEHEHGLSHAFGFGLLKKRETRLTFSKRSASAQHGHRNRTSRLRTCEAGQSASQVLLLGTQYPLAAADSRPTYR